MARDINERLTRLKNRRKGIDRLDRLAESARTDLLAKSILSESWQKRALSHPHTRYALGAMQAVENSYTAISIETAERVGKQLHTNLSMPVLFRLQGSVPLDVHIRGVSDVDLLVIDQRMLTYDPSGEGAKVGRYTPTNLTSLGILREVRKEAETTLKSAYPAATVDCSGGKCISISGGSLARPVDVVPSHWHDPPSYQSSLNEVVRGVTILNSKVPETLQNLPFLHIYRVTDADTSVSGGLKKAIRLTKNVKNDADNESGVVKLPSFDIAALLYHANRDSLRLGNVYELAILQETQRFLDWCWNNQSEAKKLRTPDGTRAILDSEAKMEGLLSISVEMDALATAVAMEQVSALQGRQPTRTQVDEALRKAFVPAAA